MAFSDPQTITISTVAIPLPRVYTGTRVGEFTASDAATRLEVTTSVSKSGRKSHIARLYQNKTTADPLVGATNVRVGDMVSLSINRPSEGYSDEEVLAQAKAFITWLTATSDANLKKLIAGEN